MDLRYITLSYMLLQEQASGWTRKGPATFTSDEFDSDDQTPLSSVSKVSVNKPFPSTDAVPAAKSFASYLGKREEKGFPG